LARRNAVGLRHESFRADADRLLAVIEPILHPPAASVVVASDVARVVSGGVDPAAIVALPTAVQVLRHKEYVNGGGVQSRWGLVATASYDNSAHVWALVR
jgi:hypothetical protein